MNEDLVKALEAAEQCMKDFVDVYERHASYVTLNEAARSLKYDGLRQVRAALKSHRLAAEPGAASDRLQSAALPCVGG